MRNDSVCDCRTSRAGTVDPRSATTQWVAALIWSMEVPGCRYGGCPKPATASS